MDLNIEKKTAIITGGDSGIGLATAKMLAKEGVNIVLSDKTKNELENASEEVRRHELSSYGRDEPPLAV